jgi:hypothetical protein
MSDTTGYDPAKFRAACVISDPGPVSWNDLPAQLTGDDDLARNIDARWGCDPQLLHFALLEVPVALLVRSLPEHHRRFYTDVMRDGPDVYLDMERQWRRAWDSELRAAGPDADPFTAGDDYPDGERRHRIVCSYRDDLLAGRAITPIVIDLHNLADSRPGLAGVDLLDGMHRLTAALCAGAVTLPAYEILED